MITKRKKKILFYLDSFGYKKDSHNINMGGLGLWENSKVEKLLSLSDNEDEFIDFAVNNHLLGIKKHVTGSSKLRKIALRQNSFRSRKKEDYAMTQIYLEKDLKQRFKDDCIKKDISMQDAFNSLLRDYLV
nr:hypothetical protein [Pseudodesulfovibrio sp.]